MDVRSYRLLIIVCFSVFANMQIVMAQKLDSTTAVIAPEYDQVGTLHRFWLGDSYRKLYNTPVRMRTVDLSTENGGMEVVKLGGGMQTQSLRLIDIKGREWVLRSIQKYPERSLPEYLRNTIAKDIVQDQISIAHPFGALTVPTFNGALQIPHAKPELVYVLNDPRLGEYREIFKNRAYIFEPRTPDEENKTDNTEKVIRKTLEDNDVQVDQKLTLRARLLDMVLGDWDRHEDNWRWAPYKEDGKTLYTPVPRDRDKVYYKTSGVFPTLLSMQWLKAHLQPYSPKIRNISHWNFNARHFDRYFLTYLNRNDWDKEIRFFQEKITDSVIHMAMQQMPDTIAKLSAGELIQNITSRRNDLTLYGNQYYEALAKVVDIPLSEKNEFIEIEVRGDGSINLSIHNKKKDGTQGRKILKRHFLPEETEELRIYGLAGNDEYSFIGSGKSRIKLRIIGGKDKDRYSVSPEFKTQHNVFLYESKAKSSNEIFSGKSIKYRLMKDSLVHQFDYNQFVYDRKGVIANLNYGVDRGLILGLGYVIQKQGFRKNPYAYQHQFSGSYLSGRGSFIFDYLGRYTNVFTGHNLVLEAKSLGPRNQSNFFGYGNETVFEKDIDDGIEFYRNRYDVVNADVALEKELSKDLKILYGSTSEFYTSSAKYNEENFFHYYSAFQPSEKLYGTNFHTGFKVGINLDTRDNITNPKKGWHIDVLSKWMQQLGADRKSYSSLASALSFYKTLKNEKLTFANRTGMQAVWGNPYFYQHAAIGGENSLRGFNSNRFIGKTSLYNNLDVRIKIWSFSSYYLPGTIGAITFYDVGRVWKTQEDSKIWHMGYGGGFYFAPADLFTIQATIGLSNEAILPYIRIGLSF